MPSSSSIVEEEEEEDDQLFLQLCLLRLEVLRLLLQSLMELLIQGMDVSVDGLLHLLRPSRHILGHRCRGQGIIMEAPHAINVTPNYL